MVSEELNSSAVNTPALIFDEKVLLTDIERICTIVKNAQCELIYSLKPLTLYPILSIISNFVDGFGVSSLFEAKLIQNLIKMQQTVHFTSPGMRKDELKEMSEYCDHICYNSLSQWESCLNEKFDFTGIGLRVNPEISFINDERYDPCRKYSKLGIPINDLQKEFKKSPAKFTNIQGLHFHTNCESNDFSQLLQVVQLIDRKLDGLLKKVDWINIGGGYYFDTPKNINDFYKAVDILKNKYDLRVIVEPGAAFVLKSGTLISTVIDLFKNDDKEIAVLDTTVNHMTEVFEYQYEPDIAGHTENGEYEYILAGASCLSGDIIGEYSFNESLNVGSRLTIENIGAYSFVKSNTFNGINLPDIYLRDKNEKINLIKKNTYEDYSIKNGV